MREIARRDVMCVSEYRHFGLMLKATGLLALLISSKVWVSYSSAFLLALPVRRRPPVGHLGSAPPSLTDWAPSWKSIEQQLFSTDKGRRPHELKKERLNGRGPPNARATLRLFHETDESNVNVTFYRDAAAWCPYCQKVWIYLEERHIPYRVKTVPLNAYGDKPAWYSRLVDGGNVPAIELHGTLFTESLEIIKVLNQEFGTSRFIIDDELMQLDKRVQQDWFSLVFYPVEGKTLENSREAFLETMRAVNDRLGATQGPWFGGRLEPSVIDIILIPTMERIEASILYWRNVKLRGVYPNIDAWLKAWEEHPSYMATKSDFFTLCSAMPSQNGPGYFSPDAKDVASQIYGLDGAWGLGNDCTIEQVNVDDESARFEALYRMIENHASLVKFCARAAGEPGTPSFHAELADPYAEPNEEFVPAIDTCLRHVANALLNGANSVEKLAYHDLQGVCVNEELLEGWEAYEEDGRTYYWNYETGDVAWTPPTGDLSGCLAYLRDRVGVPRDMSYPAARQLRMHLNWAIEILRKGV